MRSPLERAVVAADPLTSLLTAAAETAPPRVQRWLERLLAGDTAERAAARGAAVEDDVPADRPER